MSSESIIRALKRRHKADLTFAWREGARINVPVEDAVQVFNGLIERDGAIRPAAVVAVSEDDDTPLHGLFNWDDEEAAHLYRVDQARDVIRQVRIRFTRADGSEAAPSIRAYASIPITYHEPEEDEGVVRKARAYLPIVTILSNEELRQRRLHAALLELEGWKRRYNDLEEVAALFAVMQASLPQVVEPAPEG